MQGVQQVSCPMADYFVEQMPWLLPCSLTQSPVARCQNALAERPNRYSQTGAALGSNAMLQPGISGNVSLPNKCTSISELTANCAERKKKFNVEIGNRLAVNRRLLLIALRYSNDQQSPTPRLAVLFLDPATGGQRGWAYPNK